MWYNKSLRLCRGLLLLVLYVLMRVVMRLARWGDTSRGPPCTISPNVRIIKLNGITPRDGQDLSSRHNGEHQQFTSICSFYLPNQLTRSVQSTNINGSPTECISTYYLWLNIDSVIELNKMFEWTDFVIGVGSTSLTIHQFLLNKNTKKCILLFLFPFLA